MNYVTATHDRMLSGLILPCAVVGVDLAAGRLRVSDGAGWTSAWVRWHSQAAGKARHWRAPSLGEQGVLISPSGEPAQGTFVPGLYGDAGAQPDNREHVEVWRFDDGGSLVYDWQAKSYSISLPSGTVTIQVGTSSVVVTDSSITGNADSITLTGAITLNGEVQINGASLKHNGVNVGSTHIHPGVMPGPGATAPPQ
ncbi:MULTISPECIES: phage baseplate assembly protein V [unclassified Pseudomonas]|uniref:phage baseplate assembly protein V n=1 Tax=Pseudomonas TaxID=286 RepID=UPI00087753C5|nr:MULTISPECIES: phage baseplate assembly protein V [unclassified Pseudomonas]SCZ67331.1 phage baseplate assembly protein V [Pseudomonas sp. NFPP17]SDA64734.1 phage baseplate assembly protein V [Pseudomonas sp. NFPP15]SEL09530.1 phage baseplate assembly protein V [Pseudomonas sp. NFPP18]SFA61383.1 phage baseplate assembly protein V [Pseudomonas sp. NFPP13]SFT78862.1 phage baseplate assembly protein V [Pseudomonas sp. NFPP25]